MHVYFNESEIQFFFLIFCRTLGLILSAPIFSNSSLIPQLKIGLALLVSYLLSHVIPINPNFPLGTSSLLYCIATETFIGVLIGFTSHFILDGIQLGGQLIGFQVGFSVVNVIDPNTSAQSSLISIFHGIFSLFLFLSINGHHWFLSAIRDSFMLIPPGNLNIHGNIILFLTEASSQLFVVSVKIAAPVVIVLLLSDVAMGAIARTVPQIQILIVAFPLKIGVGLIVMGLSMTYFAGNMHTFFHQIHLNIYRLLKII
ncbi:MAG: flagellar biosynthetic protein FliR [Candidatus Schekmanbacteria bacterium RBG_13_48_7]|uniref:Flagellar biosynthetic protein FliR n=1 Tax=Candidatus Schekmanbacteria bacterium RBG_13_48_7 TaxID=1817878 RepID=A0A1F7RTR5_9BACT|nr:MAG: flagellar biosynthetic protein FliR [Candidatus Schekmanbacteria bacterium RBG_13_48_7]